MLIHRLRSLPVSDHAQTTLVCDVSSQDASFFHSSSHKTQHLSAKAALVLLKNTLYRIKMVTFHGGKLSTKEKVFQMSVHHDDSGNVDE